MQSMLNSNKYWEIYLILKFEKVWESMRKYEKVWESLRHKCSQKFSK